MTNCAEEVLKRLEIPYRWSCSPPATWASRRQKTYDIESGCGAGAYREISSCSNCGDFPSPAHECALTVRKAPRRRASCIR